MNLDGLWIVPHGAVTEYERKRFFFALDISEIMVYNVG